MNDTPEEIVAINEKSSFNNIVIVLVGTFAIIGLLVASYIHLSKQVLVREEIIVSEQAVVSKPVGSIYLTLEPEGISSMGIYKFDFSDDSLTPYYVQPNGLAMTGKFINGADSGMLISEYLSDGTLQIVVVAPETKERVVLTNSATIVKRHPLFSAYYNVILYSARPESGEVLVLPDEFSVHVIEANGSEREVTKGAMPAMAPDEKSVVVLRNDGLYMVDISGSSSEKIWGYEEGEGRINRQFNVSPTGEYIAWTFPDLGKIYVAEVTSWSPFKSYVKYIIESHAFWPIFSPDGEYLAFEEVDWADPPTKPRLVVIDLKSPTLERKVFYDLSEFDQLKMFISDWK